VAVTRPLRRRPARRARGAGRARRRRSAPGAGPCRPRAARLGDYRIGYMLDDPHAPVSSEAPALAARWRRCGRRGAARLAARRERGGAVRRLPDPALRALPPPAREDQLPGLRQLAANQDGSYLSRYAARSPRRVSADHRTAAPRRPLSAKPTSAPPTPP
jgi:hypothetical protein